MPGAYEVLRPHVEPGEQLLWAGKPRQGLVLRTSDLWLIPLTFALAAIPASVAHELFSDPGGFPAFAKLLFAVGIIATSISSAYLVVGRFIADRWYRARLSYGITNSRIIIVSELFGTRITEFSLSALRGLQPEEKRSGRGTFNLAPVESTLMSNGFDIWHPVLGRPPQLFEIEEPRKVLGIIRRASR